MSDGGGKWPLRFESASVGYAGPPVVSEVNLSVEAGEIVGLVGPNGAGKSTLLRAVTGSARVLSGRLAVSGVGARELSARGRARLVGVVPQSLTATFSFSGRQFVEMGRDPWLKRFGGLSEQDHKVVGSIMERTDTARLASEMIDTLSGGDLQRLALAQALAQQPKVLLLDESTSHLDLNHRLQVLDLIQELARDGMAVLAVFHDLDLAARYSDRIAVVSHGRVEPAAAPREVLTAEVVARVFEVKAVAGTDPVTGCVTVTPILRDQAVAARRDQNILLVCGSGTGASLMRRLVLAGYDVSCAALNVGDSDHSVAAALGLDRVDLPPFAVIDHEAKERVVQLASRADACVVCETPFGRANLANLEAVVSSGRPVMLVGELTQDRDFAQGDASRLWRMALDAGAAHARDESEALAVLEQLVPLRP